jgi:hypothetical protein
LQADVLAGGSYVFTCTGTIDLTKTLDVSKDLSLATQGQAVTLYADDIGWGEAHGDAQARVFDITGGTVTLSGLSLTGGNAVDFASPPAANGEEGAQGENGADPGDPGLPGSNGTDGTAGGAAGPIAQGGGLYIGTGATVTLVNDTIDDNDAGNWNSNDGGAGGNGGGGGSCDCVDNSNPNNPIFVPAAGGNGSDGGAGGNAGPEGDAQGGGMFLAPKADVTLIGDIFYNDWASSGGGAPANAFAVAGDGGYGGGGGVGYSGTQSDMLADYGTDGNGAVGGTGSVAGVAQGGAIYVSSGATLTVQGGTFGEDYEPNGAAADGGGGGLGGLPGADCVNTEGGCDYEYGTAGAGGDGGPGGTAQGGAIYNEGTLNLEQASFDVNRAAAQGGPGWISGSYDYCDASCAAVGGDGGEGGTAEGGAIYTTTPIDGLCADFTSGTFFDTANTISSVGGAAGVGNPDGSAGASGTAQEADVYGAQEPAACTAPCPCPSCTSSATDSAMSATAVTRAQGPLDSVGTAASTPAVDQNVGSQNAVIFSTFPPGSTSGNIETDWIKNMTKILQSENYRVTVYRSAEGKLANGDPTQVPGTATLANFISAASAGVLIISSHGGQWEENDKPAGTAILVEDYGAALDKDRKHNAPLNAALANYEANPQYKGLISDLGDGIGLTPSGIEKFFANNPQHNPDQLIFAGTCYSFGAAPDFQAASYFGYQIKTSNIAAVCDWDTVFGRLDGTLGAGEYRDTLSAWQQGGFQLPRSSCPLSNEYPDAPTGVLDYSSTLTSGEGLVLSPAVSSFSYPNNSDHASSSRAGPFVVHFDAPMDTSIAAADIVNASSASVKDAKWVSSTELSFDLKRGSTCSATCKVDGFLTAKMLLAAGSFNNLLDGNTNPDGTLAAGSGIAPNGYNYDFTFDFTSG